MKLSVDTKLFEPLARSLASQRWAFTVIIITALFVAIPVLAAWAGAVDDAVKVCERKQKELKDKEDALKEQEKRLEALRKEIDERIDRYTKLVNQYDAILKRAEQSKAEQLEQLVKTYDAMNAEEAAKHLAMVDEATAVKILTKMKSKKAAAVMGVMEPKKVASLTEAMSRVEKKVPTR